VADFRASITIDATPERIFEYLVTPEGMTSWMGQWAELAPTPGGAFSVDIQGYPIRGEYLAVEPHHHVAVSWGMAGSDELPPGYSRVDVTLTPIDDGTRVDLVHSGLPDDRLQGHATGWRHFLPRLAGSATGHPAGPDIWQPGTPED
jgi:uncharacterized protein YndB with AHSA1/START domain